MPTSARQRVHGYHNPYLARTWETASHMGKGSPQPVFGAAYTPHLFRTREKVVISPNTMIRAGRIFLTSHVLARGNTQEKDRQGLWVKSRSAASHVLARGKGQLKKGDEWDRKSSDIPLVHEKEGPSWRPSAAPPIHLAYGKGWPPGSGLFLALHMHRIFSVRMKRGLERPCLLKRRGSKSFREMPNKCQINLQKVLHQTKNVCIMEENKHGV